MPGYTNDQIGDFTKITRKNFGGDQYTNLMLSRNKLLIGELFEMHSGTFEGSTIEESVLVSGINNTRWKGKYAKDQIEEADINLKITVGSRQADTGYAVETSIVASNNSMYKIIDYLRQKEVHCWTGFWDFMESWWWGHTTADDGESMYSLRFWNTKNQTTLGSGDVTDLNSLQGEFCGGQYYSGVNPGGLNHPYYKSYNKKYGVVSRGDLVAKLLFAMDRCAYRAAVPYPATSDVANPSWGLYCKTKTKHELRQVAEQANDNLGFDFGTPIPTFNGVPLMDVPALDYDSDDPVYGCNWNAIGFKFRPELKGRYTYIAPDSRQHTVAHNFYDWEGNSFCNDRRSQFCLATGVTS